MQICGIYGDIVVKWIELINRGTIYCKLISRNRHLHEFKMQDFASETLQKGAYVY